MVSLVRTVLIILYLTTLATSNFTRVAKRDVLLTRRKRYLMFPPGSNFVVQCASVKALLRIQPLYWNILEEMDFPFALPNDNKWIRYFRGKGKRERRQVYRQIGSGFTQGGLNGTACVKRMICDIQNYYHFKGKSLLKDILLSLFTIDNEASHENFCNESVFSECSTSIIDYIFGGYLSQTTNK